MSTKLKYILLLFTLTSCNVTKNWNSEQNQNTFRASYEDFNGKEKIKLNKNADKIVYVSYLSKNRNGIFSLKINRDNFLYIPNKVNHFKATLNKPLIIKISGNNASGKFWMEYPLFVKKNIKVQYNKNFELLCLAYFLSNVYENVNDNKNTFRINEKKIAIKDMYTLNLKIADEFKKFSNSDNLKTLKEFFKKQFYLNYAKFVFNLNDFPNAIFQESNPNLRHLFASKEKEKEFISALNNFYKEIKFSDFLEEYEPYYNEMITEVKRNLPDMDFIVEMEHLYDKEVNGYFLNPSLTMPFSQGYALSMNNKIGYVFGSPTVPLKIKEPDNLVLGYANSKRLRNISVHEFGHSFVNPIINQIEDSIIINKKYLYNPIEKKMSEQGYSSWKISLYEHFVRAGEIFIAEQLGDQKTANKLSKDYIIKRKFIYLKQIIPAMKEWYNNNYFEKSYSDFVKETIKDLK